MKLDPMRRYTGLLMGVALLLLAGPATLFASGGSDTAGAVTYPVKIEYWYSIGGAPKDATDVLTAKFNGSQTKYQVTGVFMGGYPEGTKKLLAAAVAKNLPALGHLGNTYPPQLVAGGAIQPLDDIMKADKTFNKDEYVPAMFAINQFDGKTWGLPFNNSTGIFYVNRDIFKQAGIGADKIPETWTDFRDMLRAMKNKVPSDVALFNFRPGSGWINQAYLYTFGGTFLAPDNKSAPWDTKEFLECLTYFQGLKKEGLLTWNGSMDGFYAGKQAIVTESTGAIGNMIKRCNFDLGTNKIMRGSKQAAVIGGGTIHLMAGQARGAQEAGWSFMKFLTGKDSQVYWSDTTGYLACNKAAVEELTNTTHKTDPRYAVAFKQMLYAVRENATAAASFDAVRDVFVAAWDRVMVNDEDPKTVLVEAQKKASQVIRDF